MSTLVAEPIIQEVNIEPPAVRKFDLHEGGRSPAAAIAGPKEETNPFVIILIACFIAFNLAAAMVGTIVAWVYQLRHSGAFTP